MTLGQQTKPTARASSLSHDDVQFFVDMVDKAIGVQLQGKEYLIESRLEPVAVACGLGSVNDLFRKLRMGDRAAQQAAVEAMTTNETSFFRDQHPFQTLAQELVPELRRASGGTLNIWNGACSSGQESYTLAITLREHVAGLDASQVKILSTDVSPKMVERCREGKYSRFEVNRGLSSNLSVKYFDQVGRSWVAKPELRSMITVRELNLLRPWSGIPKSDLVLLRNVLIYFTPAVKQDILRRIRTDVLKPHGALILGASESIVGIDAGYEMRRVGQSTLYFPKGS
jgi:chemotaxis protein methyltransferase CheR